MNPYEQRLCKEFSLKKNNYIYFFLAVRGLWLCMGFSLWGTSLLVAHKLQVHGLQYLWTLGLVAPQHVVPSQIRDRTCVSCTDRWILYHWTTREASRDFLIGIQRIIQMATSVLMSKGDTDSKLLVGEVASSIWPSASTVAKWRNYISKDQIPFYL